MSSGNLFEFGQAWWAEARKKCKNAAVFLDSVSCECLHWNGGAPSIFEAGALCIKELSSFEVVPANAKKAVFISSAPLYGTTYKILENLIKNSKLEYCVIITSAHASVHHLLHWGLSREGQHEMDAFHKVEEDVLTWMGNLNYTVEIFNYPISTIHPTRESFLIPSARSVEPLLPSDLGYVNQQLHLFNKQAEASTVRSIHDLTFATLPLPFQAQIRQLVNNLNQLLQHINARDEIFTVGSFSRIIGTELEALNAARTRRKVATNKVSVIFVDRVLDLANATKCSSDNLFDRFFHIIDRLHEQSNDVSVCLNEKAHGELTTAPGCLAPQSDWAGTSKTMEHLFHLGQQEGMEYVSEDILQAGDSNQPLADFLDEHSNDWDFVEQFTHLFQVGKAVLQSQKSDNGRKMDRMEKLQKSLIESLDDPDALSPLVQILQLIKTRGESGLTLDDILVLLVHLYALAGEDRESIFPEELEDRLKGVLAETIIDAFDELSDKFQDFVGIPVDEVRAYRAGQKIVEHLHHISEARSIMKKFVSLYHRSNPAMPLECTSILKQLIEDIFDPAVTDHPDLEHKSGGLKDLLKTGFSLFVNVRKPKPTDPLIIIYVCGGIRPDEVKMVRDMFRDKIPSHTVMIGSSHFISAQDSLQFVFKKSSYS